MKTPTIRTTLKPGPERSRIRRLIGLPVALAAVSLLSGSGNLSGQTPSAPPPALSPGVADVLKLTQAQVNDQVIRAFVLNSPATFQLGAEEIIFLKQQGVSPDVMTAMLNRSSQLRAQPSAPAQPASNPTTYAPAVTPTYAAPPVYASTPAYPSSSVVYYPSYSYAYPSSSYWWLNYSWSSPWYYPTYWGGSCWPGSYGGYWCGNNYPYRGGSWGNGHYTWNPGGQPPPRGQPGGYRGSAGYYPTYTGGGRGPGMGVPPASGGGARWSGGGGGARPVSVGNYGGGMRSAGGGGFGGGRGGGHR